MPLIDGITNVINVADYGVSAMDLTGVLNTQGFNDAVMALYMRDLPIGAEPSHRGTIYVPPGRYKVAVDGAVRDNWSRALTIPPPPLTVPVSQATIDAMDARRWREFGSSVLFPQGVTLWLAPGAVLVPTSGCIIDISSALICDDSQCFDLSEGGLVVFGTAVPVLRPEWWASPPDAVRPDPVHPIQRAIDAAVHDRSIQWQGIQGTGLNVTNTTHKADRPALVVELRGLYTLQQTVEVQGDRAPTGLIAQLRAMTPGIYPLPSRAETPPPPLGAGVQPLIRGSWGGAGRQGATLIAGDSLGQNPLLRLAFTPGLTVRNLTFSTQEVGYQPGVELSPFSVDRGQTGSTAIQRIAFFSCRFEGASTTLVQVGQQAVPVRNPLLRLPYSSAGFPDADFTFLSFEDCDFIPLSGGVGVDVRAAESLPIRFRRCEFFGYARAMLSLSNATHYLEDCRFQNARFPSVPLALSPGAPPRGFEEPDGSDLFLRRRYPVRILPAPPQFDVTNDKLPGITAIGCVSLSYRFLSTARPTPNDQQRQEWPVVLVNIRHRAPGRPVSSAVRWGQQNDVGSVSVGSTLRQRMGRGSPLVIIGGTFSSEILVLRGAVQAAVIGSRVQAAYGMDGSGQEIIGDVTPGVVFEGWWFRFPGGDGLGDPAVVSNPTIVFGLLEDTIDAFFR